MKSVKFDRRLLRLWIQTKAMPVILFILWAFTCLSLSVVVFLVVMKMQNAY